jgi:hypothetical protein
MVSLPVTLERLKFEALDIFERAELLHVQVISLLLTVQTGKIAVIFSPYSQQEGIKGIGIP